MVGCAVCIVADCGFSFQLSAFSCQLLVEVRRNESVAKRFLLVVAPKLFADR
jgi:hypothetical protein